MIAKLVREHFLKAMGSALDFVRMSDVGERQLQQIAVSIRDEHNKQMVQLFSELASLGLIEECACLKAILAKRNDGSPKEEMEQLYNRKTHCTLCGGAGYIDKVSFEASTGDE